MLMIILKDKEELIEEINNGKLQQDIYEYLKELDSDKEQRIEEPLNDKEVYSFFDAEIGGNNYISYEKLMNPYDEISLVLHNLISNVYRRFIKESNQNGGNDGGNYGANSGFDI
ncbi:hypothetical protein [Thomasclavelia spiroformis]|uniref:hypothetical protein n=1 Tax=Thomasclavelia spiroformis TaxID=29348 RepID=UPI00241CCD8E|nr:hypothetical protein [Thomasclavelia spiroformis]MBS6686403.1 hypothetical protein [Thomasclavelia spiroformis]